MQQVRIDFDNPGLPQSLGAVEGESQSRIFQATLYKSGAAYTAPAGAVYSIMYRGFGPQNQGWYDTIEDGAGKRAACTVSGNVVTCELARQALRVPGHLTVVLCVTDAKGYMLKNWPIMADVRNDGYEDTGESEMYFNLSGIAGNYLTQLEKAMTDAETTRNNLISTSAQAKKDIDAKAAETLKSIPESYTELDGSVKRLQEDVVNKKHKLDIDVWVNGMVANGNPGKGNTNRVRTSYINWNSEYCLYVEIKDGYSFFVTGYSTETGGTSNWNYNTDYYTKSICIKFPKDIVVKSIIITYKKNDDSDIRADDHHNVIGVYEYLLKEYDFRENLNVLNGVYDSMGIFKESDIRLCTKHIYFDKPCRLHLKKTNLRVGYIACDNFGKVITSTWSGWHLADTYIPEGMYVIQVSKEDDSAIYIDDFNGVVIFVDESVYLAPDNISDKKMRKGWLDGKKKLTTNNTRACTDNVLYFNQDVYVNISDARAYSFAIAIYDNHGDCISVEDWRKNEELVKAGTFFRIGICKDDDSDLSEYIDVADTYYTISKISSEIEGLPKYYFDKSYIQNKANTIINLERGCIANGDSFIFITDMHWTLNAKNSPKLVKYIAEKARINKLFDGGDDANGNNAKCSEEFRKNFSGDIFSCAGNHEYAYANDITESDLFYNFNMWLPNNVVWGDPSRNYYYVDNTSSKIRYVITNGWLPGALTGFEEKQQNWIKNIALNVPDGYEIVIFTHALYEDSGKYVFPIAENIETILDEHQRVHNNIISIFQGHNHRDAIMHTKGTNIPIIITSCDKYKPYYDNGESDINVTREIGTITEQCFDVVIINKNIKKITLVRIGGKAKMDDAEVEIREVNY